MVGRGVLLEALDSPGIVGVLSVGRHELDLEHPKLRQIVHDNFEDFDAISDAFPGLDACFWCLGSASSGLDESTYPRITYN
jgi:hypothetical protein